MLLNVAERQTHIRGGPDWSIPDASAHAVFSINWPIYQRTNKPRNELTRAESITITKESQLQVFGHF